MAADTFRLMDPVSQRMMGLRADITPQVGRIAASRLTKAPRPIRLSYAGQVLRVKGEQMRPERQIGQAGVELIGTTAPPPMPR
jgi:ATP phosphoribosyltransferase regulatory subunit